MSKCFGDSGKEKLQFYRKKLPAELGSREGRVTGQIQYQSIGDVKQLKT